MLSESIDEYKEISSSVDSEYTSIMKYSITISTLSGIAFAALFRIGPFTQTDSAGSLVLIQSMLLVINVTLLIQIVINYRFTSYNRLVAYRQLIASERFETDVREVVDGKKVMFSPAVAYDVCMDHINHVYETNEFYFDEVDEKFFSRKGIFGNFPEETDELDRFVANAFPRNVKFPGRENYGDRRHDRHVYRWLGSIPILILMAFGFSLHKKGSWRFISYINRVIVYIVLIEICVTLYWLNSSIDAVLSSDFQLEFLILFGLQSAVALFAMREISIYWQETTFGGKRAFSYFVQFLPFRMIYLRDMYSSDKKKNAYSLKPYYVGQKWEIDEEKESNSLSERLIQLMSPK